MVAPCPEEQKQKVNVLNRWLDLLDGKNTIVFVDSVLPSQELAADVGAACFHARMQESEKKRLVEDFEARRAPRNTIVSTSGLEAGLIH